MRPPPLRRAGEETGVDILAHASINIVNGSPTLQHDKHDQPPLRHPDLQRVAAAWAQTRAGARGRRRGACELSSRTARARPITDPALQSTRRQYNERPSVQEAVICCWRTVRTSQCWPRSRRRSLALPWQHAAPRRALSTPAQRSPCMWRRTLRCRTFGVSTSPSRCVSSPMQRSIRSTCCSATSAA